MWPEPFALDLEQHAYDLSRVASFRRPDDEFGGFSNMSVAYPLRVFGLRIRSSEHLYQVARFSEHPEVQQLVLETHTPMFAKRVAREFNAWTRTDWTDIRVDVMRWALRVKLAQHLETFGKLLDSTGSRPIVEYSRHDPFWGAFPIDGLTVRGQNVLGQLLIELRNEFRQQSREAAAIVPAPRIPGFLLLGAEIGDLFPKRPEQSAPFVTSQDLLSLGLPPGPEFGFMTQVCFQKQLAGAFEDKSAALRFAEQLWKDRESKASCERIRKLLTSTEAGPQIKAWALKVIGETIDRESYDDVCAIVIDNSNDDELRRAALLTLYDLDAEFNRDSTRSVFIQLIQDENTPTTLKILITSLCRKMIPKLAWLKDHIESQYGNAGLKLSSCDLGLLSIAGVLNCRLPNYSQQLIDIITDTTQAAKDRVRACYILTDCFPQTALTHHSKIETFISNHENNQLATMRLSIRLLRLFINKSY